MRFAKELEADSIPEWRKMYINYSGLKKRLNAIEKYRRLNHQAENARLEQVIHAYDEGEENPMPNIFRRASEVSPTNRVQFTNNEGKLNRLRSRTGSISTNLLKRFSYRGRRQSNSAETSKLYDGGNSPDLSVLEELLNYVSEPEQAFFKMLDEELTKVSQFYDEKEKEAITKSEALKAQLQIVQDFATQLSEMNVKKNTYSVEARLNPLYWFRRSMPDNISQNEVPILPPTVNYNDSHHMTYKLARSRLKKAITEYYRSLELLKAYRYLNKTGFQKILKKFDKIAGWKATPLYLQKIRKCSWTTSDRIDRIISNTEDIYIREFTDGDRRKGMSNLRLPEGRQTHFSVAWRIGFYLGVSLAILIQVYRLAIDPELLIRLPYIWFNMQMYACFSLPILFCLGFAVNTFVWTKLRINYKFIFEFDARDNMSYHEFAELPSLMLLLLSIAMYLDLSEIFSPTIPSHLCPLLLVITLIAIMTCPFPILYYTSRRWLGRSLGRIVFSFVFPIEFRDFFIADELNSLAYSFWTFTYFICAYHWNWTDLDSHCSVGIFWYTPIIASLPPWWRFLQCLRRFKDSGERVHLVNGMKYVTSICSTLVTGYRRAYPGNTMTIVWIICCIINSSYTSIWDLKMDWGILQLGSKNFLLRDEIVFYKWSYYAAAVVDIALRFAWTLNAAGLAMRSEMLGFLTALLEAYRRILWNFFRLENEHLNNCGNFRAIKDIPLPFTFCETYTPLNAEENGTTYTVQPEEPLHTTLSASPTLTTLQFAPKLPTPTGSFYGRRDFESRQDTDDGLNPPRIPSIKRHPSIMGAVLRRIHSKKADISPKEHASDIEEVEEESDESE